ncbi:MAG TPA: hypothetical protein VMV49_15015 [Candidatus Deferrimicrobium sp.]|nr:hypothetical protein [Candidatus Deferrimicrobium sp.]
MWVSGDQSREQRACRSTPPQRSNQIRPVASIDGIGQTVQVCPTL